MKAGLLNRQVLLQQPATGQDDVGQPLTGWTDVATVWADVRVKSGVEVIKAGAEVSTLMASVRIRYRTGVTAGMRFLIGGTAYNIKAVMPDIGGREYVDTACEVVQ